VEDIMAFIDSIRFKGREDLRLDPTQTIAVVSVSENDRGQKFLNVRSYGSELRKNRNQIS